MTFEINVLRPCGREQATPRMTRHAEIRAFDQRMVPPVIIEALIDYGVDEPAGNGCEKFHFTKRSWQKLHRHFGPALKAMERYRNCYLILANDGMVVTVGWLQ